MNSTDESDSDSFRSSVSSPGMPNTYRTPSASRHSTNTSEALRAMIARNVTATLAAVAATLAAAALLVAAPAAEAASSFYISGAGNGHGIGMSQYGADGYAQHGWTYRQILAHYYQGTAIGATSRSQPVRVLLGTGGSGPPTFTGADS